MTDTKPDAQERDPRSDIEQAVESRADAAKAADGGADTSPLAPSGIEDGVSGTAGEVKNQDDMAQ